MNRFTTLHAITTDICMQLGDDNLRSYPRVARAVKKAVDDIFNNLLPIVKTELFEVPDNLVITLPEGAGIVTKVAVMDHNGTYILLYHDSKIRRTVYNKLLECDPKDIVGNNEPVVFYNTWYQGTYYGELYCTTNDPMRAGTYRYDLESGTVELGSNGFVKIGDEVMIEYKDQSDERYIMIPSEAASCVNARSLYHYNLAANPRSAAYMFEQFKIEFKRLKSLYVQKTLEDFIRPFLRGQHSGVK
jgi:hypothetical protein